MKDEFLINKIKTGLEKSGFIHEIKNIELLFDKQWTVFSNSKYFDFETNKLREFDIKASKEINNFNIHLFIECKKSINKQMVLYSPRNINTIYRKLFAHNFKYFPNTEIDELVTPQKNIFNELDFFNDNIPISKNLIICSGENSNGNKEYIDSIDSLIKSSFSINELEYLDFHRTIIFYIFLWNGQLYNLSYSNDSDYSLNETEYGLYEYQTNFHIDKDTNNYYCNTYKKLKHTYTIEIIKDEYFSKYLENIEKTISSINLQKCGLKKML